MKRMLSVFLLLPLLTGCVTMERLDSIRSSAEKLMEDSVESAAVGTAPTDGSLLTGSEAERIALEDSGLNRGQVSRMDADYDFEEGRHIYEVEFRQGHWKYEYKIDARTGEVLSRSREQD